MIFYFGGGVGLTAISVDAPSSPPPDASGASPSDLTAFSAVATVGVEYFIPWFPNLGLNFEFSAGLTLADDYFLFGLPNPSGGHEIANVGSFGFHYYFKPRGADTAR